MSGLKSLITQSICAVMIFGAFNLVAQEENESAAENTVPLMVEENAKCFQCHGQEDYEYYNEMAGRAVSRLMCTDFQIDSAEFYESNHKTFSCLDCHSPDYESYPHPVTAKGEYYFGCLDCHGYDESYAHFQFEEIQEEYEASVHHELLGDEFSCWKCHDPHTYKLSMRTGENVRNTVAYDNAICLECHGSKENFKLLTDREINIIETHEWLPNQGLHFQSVRCIDCHTELHDTLLVAHKILPKEKAVRNCVECHSGDSKLLASLYKYKVKEGRSKYGFLNPQLAEDYYIIGATRNVFLNILSLVIFGIVIAGIVVHIILRKKNS